jgi:hypothetical protein
MCLLWGTNWVFMSQKTAFFVVTAVKSSNLKGYRPLFHSSVGGLGWEKRRMTKCTPTTDWSISSNLSVLFDFTVAFIQLCSMKRIPTSGLWESIPPLLVAGCSTRLFAALLGLLVPNTCATVTHISSAIRRFCNITQLAVRSTAESFLMSS